MSKDIASKEVVKKECATNLGCREGGFVISLINLRVNFFGKPRLIRASPQVCSNVGLATRGSCKLDTKSSIGVIYDRFWYKLSSIE